MFTTKFLKMMFACLLAAMLVLPGTQAQRKKQIAVLNFDFVAVDIGLARQAFGNQENLAINISDKLINSLFALNNCVVIERSRLEKVLHEQNLGTQGRIDASTAASVGRILGVDAVVIGSVSVFDLQGMPKDSRDTTWTPDELRARITVNYRVVNTTTAVIEASGGVTGASSPLNSSPNKQQKTTSVFAGILAGKAGRTMRKVGSANKPVKVEDEDIRNVVQLAVDDVTNQITRGVESYLSGARHQSTLTAVEKQINGNVIDVNGPTIFITGISKSAVKIGDRLQVRRTRVKTDRTTGKETRISDKIGEVEIVEIQDEAIVGSFSGSIKVQEGDSVTDNLSISLAQVSTPLAGKTGADAVGKQAGKVGSNEPSKPLGKSLSTKEGDTTTGKTSPFATGKQPSKVGSAKEGEIPTLSLTSDDSASKSPLTQPKPAPVERYPVIESPDTVFEPNEFAVTVFLALERKKSLAVVTEGTPTKDGAISLPLPAQPEKQPWKIDVVLSAPDFEFVDGRNLATILLPLSKDSTKAIFRLRAKPISESSETSEISVILLHSGGFLGQISRTVKITRVEKISQVQPSPPTRLDFPLPATEVTDLVNGTIEVGRQSARKSVPPQPDKQKNFAKKEEASPQQESFQSQTQPAKLNSQFNGRKMAIDFERKQPDMTIWVKERFGKQNVTTAQIIISSNEFGTSSSTFITYSDTAIWLEAQYKKLASQSGRDLQKVSRNDQQKDQYTDAMVNGFGKELYHRLAPPLFQSAFWQLADKLGKDFDSIQIISDNPTIPWELMRPISSDGKREYGFLGAEFNVGRWHLPEGVMLTEKVPQLLALNSLSVIAPQYTGKAKLSYQESEVKVLKQIRGYREVPGRFPEVKRLFAGSPQGIIHFIGHGGILPGTSKFKDFALHLEDSTLDVQTWQGLFRGKLNDHPFFFFNACRIGETQRIANFVSGWAPAVLDAGASGYVGALWPINDRGAYEFASKFYNILESKLKTGPVTIAEVLRETRRKFSGTGDPTFLAYVYYGDPGLTFYLEQPTKPNP
jgi:curli biogenesis system outer membrane secretion channel CsgG